MTTIAQARLAEERKNWRKDHPAEFYARPKKNTDGSINLMHWELGIPGKEGTDWAGGVYNVDLKFSEDYPLKPPSCRFVPLIFHPNVFTSGNICLSILNEGQDWRPAITIKQIALGIQDLLDNPNPNSPANGDANNFFLHKKTEYSKRIRDQAKKHIPDI